MTFFFALRKHFIGRVATLGLATFMSAFLSLALLPIATRYLHASDYGTYALMISLVTLVSSAMDGGSSLFLPAVYHRASPAERGRMFATTAIIATLGGLAVATLAIVAERQFHAASAGSLIPLDAMIIAAVMVPLRSVAVITTAIFSITNRSYAIALQTIAHAVCVFVFTIAALFWLPLGGTSLLFGAACGQFAALLVGLVILNQHGELFGRPSKRWARRSLQHAGTSSAFGFISGAHGFAENSLLTALSGLGAAGFMNHARLYFNFTVSLIGTVGHNVRAASLEEARNRASQFEATRKAWTPVHMSLACAGLFFALFGAQVVDLISNGKLVGAAPFIPFLLIIAVIQNSDQAATVTLYALGKAQVAVRFQVVLTLIGMIALYPAIRQFGIYGIIAVVTCEAVSYRLVIARLARKLRRIPFQDISACFGCLLIMATALWVDSAAPTVAARAVWMIWGFALIVFVGRRAITETIDEIAHIGGANRAV